MSHLRRVYVTSMSRLRLPGKQVDESRHDRRRRAPGSEGLDIPTWKTKENKKKKEKISSHIRFSNPHHPSHSCSRDARLTRAHACFTQLIQQRRDREKTKLQNYTRNMHTEQKKERKRQTLIMLLIHKVRFCLQFHFNLP